MTAIEFAHEHASGLALTFVLAMVLALVALEQWLAHCRIMNAARVCEEREWREAEERERVEERAREDRP